MTPRILAPLLAVLAFPRLVAAPENARPAVTLDNGDTVQLCADCKPRVVRLSVTPVDASFKVQDGEEPMVVEASYGDHHAAVPVSLFKVRWEKSGNGSPLALVLEVDETIRRPGTYQLILSLLPRSGPTAPKLSLKLVHPAAELKTPEKIVVSRFSALLWMEVHKSALQLRESSRSSEITGLSSQSETSLWGTQPVPAHITLDLAEEGLDIPAGTTKPLDYRLDGDFPLGTVTGSVLLQAPQLADAVKLPFQVDTKLSRWILFVAVVLGLGLGFYVKVYLANQIQLGEALQQGRELSDKVRVDLEKFKDSIFQSTVRTPADELEKALDERSDADRIEKARKHLDEVWRAALEELNTRRKKTTEALGKVQMVTGRHWTLPAAAAAEAERARLGVETIRTLVQDEKIKEAGDALVPLQMELSGRLRDEALEWQGGMGRYFLSLTSAKVGLPAPVQSQLAEQYQKAASDLSRISPDRQVEDMAQLAATLQDLESEYRLARNLLLQCRDRLTGEGGEFRKTLDMVWDLLPDQGAVEALEKRLKAFVETVASAAAQPEEADTALQRSLPELHQAWRDALAKQLTSSAPIDSEVQQRQFVLAAEETARLVASSKGLAGSPPPSAVLGWPGLLAKSGGAALSFLISTPAPLSVPPAGRGASTTPKEMIHRAKARQSLAVAALMVVWFFSVQGQSFDGTWPTVGTAFLTAFGLDVTLDAVLAKIKS